MPYLLAWRHRKGIARFTRILGKNTVRGIALLAGIAAVAVLMKRRRSTGAPAVPPAPTDVASSSPIPTEAEPMVTASTEPDDDGVDEAGRESFPASDPPSTY